MDLILQDLMDILTLSENFSSPSFVLKPHFLLKLSGCFYSWQWQDCVENTNSHVLIQSLKTIKLSLRWFSKTNSGTWVQRAHGFLRPFLALLTAKTPSFTLQRAPSFIRLILGLLTPKFFSFKLQRAPSFLRVFVGKRLLAQKEFQKSHLFTAHNWNGTNNGYSGLNSTQRSSKS